jgi:tagatose 6-phosphate kinase
MILTITLNPSVDIGYKLDHFSLDTVNRVECISKTVGGKGLNVSRVLCQLGEDVAASGFLGGSLGEFISSQIEAIGISDYFVKIQGETRNCIAIICEEQQTEILEGGPVITENEKITFLGEFSKFVQNAEVVTISGSLPKGLTDDFYVKLLEIAAVYNIPVLLDTNGGLLESTLASESKPYLIKPNEQELADLIGEKSVDEKQLIEALKSITFVDIPWVVVTRGAGGAIVKYNETIYRARVPKIDVINAVGSGDSVIAGFAAGISRGLLNEELVKFGLSMGVLNALEEKTGHINISRVKWATNEMSVEKIL